jgi:hypothetical protein
MLKVIGVLLLAMGAGIGWYLKSMDTRLASMEEDLREVMASAKTTEKLVEILSRP